MESFIILIQSWIGDYGFLGVIAAGIVEELISPIPSSLVQGFAGAVLFSGKTLTFGNILSFLGTVPLGSAIGVTIGSLPYVWLSRTVGLSIIDRYGNKIGVTHRDIELLSVKMKNTRWDEWLFIGLRAFPLVPNVALAIYGGLTKMPIGKYVLLSMIGVFLRGIIVGGLGWLAGNALTSVSEGVSVLEKIGLIGITSCIIIYIIWKKKKVDKL